MWLFEALPGYLFFAHISLDTLFLLQGLYTIMLFFLSWFLLPLFPYFYVIFHPTITLSITLAHISPSLSPRAATVPNSQLGQRGREEAQMSVWPDQTGPVAALSLPFAAPKLTSKSDVVGTGKTEIILVFGGCVEQR